MGKTMTGPVFLITDASCFDVSYQINPWMRPEVWRADGESLHSRAVTASAALVRALRAAGGAIETVPAVKGLPDLVFPANAAIVLDGTVLPARFLCLERRGEEPVFRAAFEALKARGLIDEIAELPPGVIQEGAGDCIWDQLRGFFWAGYGQRSNRESIAAIEQCFARPVVALELAADRFYHLDTCFCPLAGGQVLYYPPAFTPAALDAIHAQLRTADRIEASDEEAAAFCVNAVSLGRTVIMAKAPQSLHRKLAAHGYAVEEVDLSPFILSGGAAYCMTLRLDRDSEMPAAARVAE
jgi:N-dimethylarginine dimethylaminohydrolase